ncbi:zinc-dependent metalloprotease [Nevskia sp.]|uniref:zinc-dependent metalloprotease n=1 Tax=Nevskia sp. TaxID=1929292 RepID=UPI0025F6AC5E|nr:zinc-dependent metalloprotease [Nevskia sp.]
MPSIVRNLIIAVVAWAAVSAAPSATAASEKSAQGLPSIATKTTGTQRFDGFLPLYWNSDEGKLYLEIPRPEMSLLYLTTLTQGLGSNDVGLDRGQVSDAKLVRFERIGPKVLLVQPNLGFRAVSDSADERRAVEQSFAESVLFGFTVVAVEGERVLVDASDFAVRDGHDAISSIARAEQGSYKFDKDRSAVHLPGTKAFPRNTEIEATVTLAGEGSGQFVKDVTPTPQAISLRERYSFIALPEPGYVPRLAQPGSGYIELNYADYATPIDAPLIQHLILRHRLQKKDPAAAISDAVQPIVYYLDRGAPPPIRDALLEGARWWNQAFEAAGYRNAFQVELLPEDADPLDVRYNIIQWVHRATRGWSYGSAVNDPRTGEIIKGNVTLGSLRARYDYLIAEGLLSPYGDRGEAGAVDPAMQKLVMARLSQLAAHEIGHTLGLLHNYIASRDGRTSVMDYPQPLVTLKADGTVDLSDAYTAGIGAWDKVAIDYGYREFPAGSDESAALAGILRKAQAQGIGFLTDEDARPAGAAHPDVSLWDNGRDNAAELRRMMVVRKAALARFGENAIRRGRPLASIEEALVPLYLYHRYQIDATAKALGGLRYVYALRGDGQTPVQAVPAAEQQQALDALIETLQPAVLRLSPALLAQLPPRPPGWPGTRELFARSTGLTFDATAPAVAASTLTISALLQPERAARLVQQQALDRSQPGFETIVDRLIAASFDGSVKTGIDQEIRNAQQVIIVQKLITLAGKGSSPAVRGIALLKLEKLRTRGPKAAGTSDGQALLIADLIRRFQSATDPAAGASPEPKLPAGPPLGD